LLAVNVIVVVCPNSTSVGPGSNEIPGAVIDSVWPGIALVTLSVTWSPVANSSTGPGSCGLKPSQGVAGVGLSAKPQIGTPAAPGRSTVPGTAHRSGSTAPPVAGAAT
jgi:hypothetical protein